jgi:adenylosuccinate lyase
VTLDFALARLAGMVANLSVHPERMAANLEMLGGVVHSGEVLSALVAHAGISREDAYRIVQRNAMATWEKLGTPEGRSFRDNLAADPEVAGRVPTAALDAAMDPARHLRHVDTVFARVFGDA